LNLFRKFRFQYLVTATGRQKYFSSGENNCVNCFRRNYVIWTWRHGVPRYKTRQSTFPEMRFLSEIVDAHEVNLTIDYRRCFQTELGKMNKVKCARNKTLLYRIIFLTRLHQRT